MISDKEREYNRRQSERKRLINKKIARRRRKIKLFIYVGIIGSLNLCFFLTGRAFGIKECRKEQQVSASEKEILNTENTMEENSKENREEILLVNRNNPLPENYEVTLVTLPDGVNRAAKEAYEPLCNMLESGQEEGLNFKVCSS